jgi:hypothetical protein
MGTGLESVVDRERCRIGSFGGGDETWSIEILVVLLAQYSGDAGDTYTIAIGGGAFEANCSVHVREGDEIW